MQTEALGVEPERALEVGGTHNTRLERTSVLTSPSRNELVTGSIRLNDADVPVKTVKIPTAPTAITSGEARKMAHFQAVGTYEERSVTIP